MKVIKIRKNGCSYTVAFESGAVRHFYGSEKEFKEWLAQKC